MAETLGESAPKTDFTLPAHILKGYLIVVSASVDDSGPFDFLVDTGTNTTLVDPKLADELGLQPVDRMSLASMNKSAPVNRYFLKSLRVGPASVSHLEVLAAPLPQLHELRNTIRGVLGMNFLLQFSFRLDYARERLELFPSPEEAQPPEGIRLHVEIHDWRILVPVESPAAPRGRWKLALDSGISELLIFENRMAAFGKGIDRCPQGHCLMQVATNLSRQNASMVRLRDLRIADTHLRDLPAVVLHNDLLSPNDPGDGLLPTALFRSVFFDRATASIIFSPQLAVMAAR